MAPHVEMRHWVPYSELAGTARLTDTEFRENLMKFPRSGVLIAIARLSMIFDFGRGANTVASDELVEQWVPRLFPPLLVHRVLAFAKQGRVIFFQGQLRYLAAEVLRLPKPKTEEDAPFAEALLGPLLFCAAEMLYMPQAPAIGDLDNMAKLVAMFLPVYENRFVHRTVHALHTLLHLPDDLHTATTRSPAHISNGPLRPSLSPDQRTHHRAAFPSSRRKPNHCDVPGNALFRSPSLRKRPQSISLGDRPVYQERNTVRSVGYGDRVSDGHAADRWRPELCPPP